MTTVVGETTIFQLPKSARSKAPVFVVGCPRSGTTLLYHMLLSAGGFVIYRAESQAFNILAHRFGNLHSERNRQQLMDAWGRSKIFQVSGINEQQIRTRVVSQARCAGDILNIFMETMAEQQGVERWADTTPDHLLYMREIKAEIPNALFIHIVRDGRDVALSFAQQGWSHPLPWDRGQELPAAALYWAWAVRRGRRSGKDLASDYMEVQFEELVGNRRESLDRVGAFIEHDLDYDRIQRAGIGSVSHPNTSFQDDSASFNPVNRWKTQLPPKQLAALEWLTGDLLQDLGYPLANDRANLAPTLQLRRMRPIYPALFTSKLWLKSHTAFGRFSDVSAMNWEAR